MSYIASTLCDCIVLEEHGNVLSELDSIFVKLNRLDFIRSEQGESAIYDDYQVTLASLKSLASSYPDICCHYFISVSKMYKAHTLAWSAIYRVLETYGLNKAYDRDLVPIFLYTISYLMMHKYYGRPTKGYDPIKEDGIAFAAQKGCPEAKEYLKQNAMYKSASDYIRLNSASWGRNRNAINKHFANLLGLVDNGRYSALGLLAQYMEKDENWNGLIDTCDFLKETFPEHADVFEASKKYYEQRVKKTFAEYFKMLILTLIGGAALVFTFYYPYQAGLPFILKLIIGGLGLWIFFKLSIANSWVTNVLPPRYGGLNRQSYIENLYCKLY